MIFSCFPGFLIQISENFLLRDSPLRASSGRYKRSPASKLSRRHRAYFGLPRVCVRDILREIRRRMPFRQTIAAKIFGLAIILLLLTIALAGFLLYEVTRTKQDLTVVANFDVPLTQSLARLHEFGLRRRLAFERWFGALNSARAKSRDCCRGDCELRAFQSQAYRRIFNRATHHRCLSRECARKSHAR